MSYLRKEHSTYFSSRKIKWPDCLKTYERFFPLQIAPLFLKLTNEFFAEGTMKVRSTQIQ